MDETDRLKEAESLITRYYEISKIRDETERVRQFIEIDSRLKEYYKQVLQPLHGRHLRLAFSERSGDKRGLRVFTRREVSPRPEQEKAIVDFTERLDEAMAYSSPLARSSDDDEDN
ncbi:MAG: hypothetical protein CMQ20_10015 [Gammaproteobacteria bacterium]|jgi:hypothetical protein|nr:hypothetical protein [Gammaproteobacteria bacterium]|tara:strand:- start:1651 stop:1998 length:348 start_codon:yes stop_codon:yes gene_type:complete